MRWCFVLTFKTRAEVVPGGWAMRSWRSVEGDCYQPEKLIACPLRTDQHRLSRASDLAEMVWRAWQHADDDAFKGLALRMRLQTADELMFMELGRKEGALSVYVEDLNFPFLVADPFSSTHREEVSAIQHVDALLAQAVTMGLEGITRSETGSSRHGLPLVLFKAAASDLKVLEMGMEVCNQLFAWPAKLAHDRVFSAATSEKLLVDGEYEFVLTWDRPVDEDLEFDFLRIGQAFIHHGAVASKSLLPSQRAMICGLCWVADLDLTSPTSPMLIEYGRHAGSEEEQGLVADFDSLSI